jgi:hypothetical protein
MLPHQKIELALSYENSRKLGNSSTQTGIRASKATQYQFRRCLGGVLQRCHEVRLRGGSLSARMDARRLAGRVVEVPAGGPGLIEGDGSIVVQVGLAAMQATGRW